MFTFDLDALDDPAFKEDSVREEIIAPFLKRLGYQPTGRARVQRSKSLVHPFVHIGTRRHPVTIIPDYTLYYDTKAVLVLDAKSPNEEILKSSHVEQAYSYSIHPGIRCRHFALCNGRHLVLYDSQAFKPLLIVAVADFDKEWSIVERFLAPTHLADPILRSFMPDLGLAVSRLGMPPDTNHIFMGCRPYLIGRVADHLYSAGVAMPFGDELHLASFDFSAELLAPILACLPAALGAEMEKALGWSPFQVATGLMIELDWVGKLGDVTNGQDGEFVPFLATEIANAEFDSRPVPNDSAGLPEHIWRLRWAYDAMKSP